MLPSHLSSRTDEGIAGKLGGTLETFQSHLQSTAFQKCLWLVVRVISSLHKVTLAIYYEKAGSLWDHAKLEYHLLPTYTLGIHLSDAFEDSITKSANGIPKPLQVTYLHTVSPMILEVKSSPITRGYCFGFFLLQTLFERLMSQAGHT